MFQTYDGSFYTVGYESMAKCGYPLSSELTVALHYLRSTLACSKTQSEPVKIHCHVIVTQWNTAVEQFARKFRNLPLQTGKAAGMSELQTHHCTSPGQWIWFLCTVGVIPANKLSMQELNQFNRNYAPDLRFTLVLSPNFQKEGRMSVLTHLRTLMPFQS